MWGFVFWLRRKTWESRWRHTFGWHTSGACLCCRLHLLFSNPRPPSTFFSFSVLFFVSTGDTYVSRSPFETHRPKSRVSVAPGTRHRPDSTPVYSIIPTILIHSRSSSFPFTLFWQLTYPAGAKILSIIFDLLVCGFFFLERRGGSRRLIKNINISFFGEIEAKIFVLRNFSVWSGRITKQKIFKKTKKTQTTRKVAPSTLFFYYYYFSWKNIDIWSSRSRVKDRSLRALCIIFWKEKILLRRFFSFFLFGMICSRRVLRLSSASESRDWEGSLAFPPFDRVRACVCACSLCGKGKVLEKRRGERKRVDGLGKGESAVMVVYCW